MTGFRMLKTKALLAWQLGLISIALCCFTQCQATVIVPSGNDISTKTIRNVCLVYYEAIVLCDATKDPSTYSGYEVELFRKTAAWVAEHGNAEWGAANYTFTCMDWDSLMNDLLLPDGNRTCDVGVAGISETSDRMAAGYKFTAPTYESGRQILIYASDKVDMFLFLNPFDETVWLMVMATSVFVGVAVLFAEVPMRRIIRTPKAALEKYNNLQWASTAMLLQAMQQFSARSVGARIIILGYAFMVLILINAYIAVLSSQLTVTSINLNVHGLSDLTTKPVGIFEADTTAFKKLNLQSLVPLPWNTPEDEANMLSLLRTGTISALVLDKPFVQYQAAVSCDLYVVGDVVLPNNLGFAFPPSTDLDYVSLFSSGITVLQETGVMGELQTQFVEPPGNCPRKSGSNLANSQITMPQIAGLWVFLGAACLGGYTYNICMWLWDRLMTCRKGDGAEDDLPVALSGHNSMNNRNQVLPSPGMGSMTTRSMSLAKANPDMGWLNVADASTTEEAMELLEAHMKSLEKKLKNIAFNIDQRFNTLNENLFGLRGEAVENGFEPLPTLKKKEAAFGDGVSAKIDRIDSSRGILRSTEQLASPGIAPGSPRIRTVPNRTVSFGQTKPTGFANQPATPAVTTDGTPAEIATTTPVTPLAPFAGAPAVSAATTGVHMPVPPIRSAPATQAADETVLSLD